MSITVPPAEKVKTFPTDARRLPDEGRRRRRSSTSARPRTSATAPRTTSPRPPPRTTAPPTWSSSSPTSTSSPADTEVDALLMEARLVKDIQPRFNVELKDDKTFPYLQIRIREDFPRVEFTRKPRRKGVKLYGPFTSAKTPAAGHPGAAAHLPVPHLHAGHQRGRPALALVPAVPAAQHPPVHRPVQLPRHARRTTASRSARCAWCWRARRTGCSREMETRDAGGRAPSCSSRRRPACATRSPPCASSASAARSTRTCSRRSSPSTRRRAWSGLRKVLGPGEDAAHHRGRGHRPPGRRGHGGVAGELHRRAAVQAGLPALQDPDASRAWTTSRRSARW